MDVYKEHVWRRRHISCHTLAIFDFRVEITLKDLNNCDNLFLQFDVMKRVR